MAARLSLRAAPAHWPAKFMPVLFPDDVARPAFVFREYAGRRTIEPVYRRAIERRSGLLGLVGRRDPLLVKSVLMHRMGLAHEEMRCDLVLGAPELPARCQQNQVIERLFR
jgi:hypothetical protein